MVEPKKDPLLAAGEEIVSTLADEVFGIEGTPMGPVKMKGDLGYRTKPLVGGQEFFVTGCRLGKRGSLIFEFQPADDRDYVLLDVKMEKLDDFFPTFLPQIVESLGLPEADGAEIMALMTQRAVAKAEALQKKAAAKAKAELETDYSTNSNFGMF